MKKKLVSVLLCAAMVASMVVGCGSKSDSGSSDSGSGDKLVYWSMWSEDEPQAKIIKSAIERYTKDTGVEVDAQFKGRNGQREGLLPALDAKQQIDIFDEDVNRVNGSWGKYLLDIEELGGTYAEEHSMKNLVDFARKAYGQANGGEETLHSIPYQPSIFGFFYNKTLFAKAGITAAPTTWEEFDAACAKLKENGIVPITGDNAYITSFTGNQFARYIGQDGVKSLVMGEESNGVTVTWDDPRVLAAAESIADFAKKGYFSENIATNKYPAGQNQEFAPGEAATIFCGSWLPNEVKDTAADDLEWGYFNFPSVPDGTDDNTANNLAYQVLAINKDTKMAEQAMELIEYITSGDTDMEFVTEAFCIPADTANGDSWPAELTDVKPSFEATTTFYDWTAGIENNPDLTSYIEENGTKLIGGQIDAAEFVAAMKKAAGM